MAIYSLGNNLNRRESASYRINPYIDNWTYGSPYIPPGLEGNQAFAVVNSDGTFSSDYPLAPLPSCTALAVGGWNNSQSTGGPEPWQNNGLYQVMTATDNTVLSERWVR